METCFYTPCPQVIVGCKLYQTNAATSFVANGYYSDGNNCYNVVSGTVSTITTCPVTGGTPYCYTTEIYPTASYQSSCLDETFTVSPLVFKVTLYDINGNQFVANTNYNFDVEFDTQICGSSDSTRILNLTVNQGQTSGGVSFIESQLVECGFGCVTESFMNPRLINPGFFDCNNVDDISCYKLEDILVNSYQETCLTSNPYIVENRNIVITLYDSAGNLATTTRDYIFTINMDEKYCLDTSPITNTYEIKILSGNSSAVYQYIPTRYQDCGQGDCILESQYFLGIESKPIEYPSLPECIPCASYTVSTTASSGQSYEYVDCYGISQTETIGGASGYDANTFCAQLNSIITTGNQLNVSYNGSCNN